MVNTFHLKMRAMSSKTNAIVKYNNGYGAMLCSLCNKIVKVGYEFDEEEKKYMRGEIKHLAPRYCEDHKKKETR